MRKVVFIIFLLILPFVGKAQSLAELEAAKSVARSYGYTETEINQILNQTTQGTGLQQNVAPATQTSTQRTAPAKDTVFLFNQPEPTKSSPIYGHDIFQSGAMSLQPSYNIPTPENYVVGAGDRLVIDVWGDSFTQIAQEVSPEGSITIPNYGPVYIMGQTIRQAERNLTGVLSRIYSGIGGSKPTTHFRLTLGQMRSISINVVGEVARPGAYTLPSLSTICSALYQAGGVSSLGTVRAITLYRDGKLQSTFDVYDFIINGNYDTNVRLQDNDIVIVSPFRNLVTLNGPVKRPMQYELKDNETVADALRFAGGFAANALSSHIHVQRIVGQQPEAFDVKQERFDGFTLANADVVTVFEGKDLYKNVVTISGPVWAPGEYALSATLSHLKELILFAGGLKEDTYTERGYIRRLLPNREPFYVNFNVEDVMSGTVSIPLERDDQIRLYSLAELRDQAQVTIDGEVNTPGSFFYADGMTLGDILLMAEGMTNAATQRKIDIARRNSRPDTGVASDSIALILTLNLEEDPSLKNFPLEPYDLVLIRRLPDFKPQQTISVSGEVVYPGTYVVEKNTVRISDVLRRSGGLNKDAYAGGATLKRLLDQNELDRSILLSGIGFMQDSLRIDSLALGDRYTVGIDLEKAIANPGSAADIVLRSGDLITIPRMNNTVKISGGVLFSNTTAYNPDYSINDYIAQAGGYVKGARRSHAYIVFMNGTMATKGHRSFKIAPGCELVIPVRDENKRRSVSSAEIVSMLASVTSLATMTIYLINSLNNGKGN